MVHVIITRMLLALCLAMTFSCSSATEQNNYVEDACNVTLHRDLCISSLSPFSRFASSSPVLWARAGVSVAIKEAKGVVSYFAKLLKNKNVTRGINGMAVSECVDFFEDTLENLYESLYVLRNLSVASFESQVDDVTTWVSAALTDEDTCVDGFDGRRRVWSVVNHRVSRVTNMTSNALALINTLALAGPQCLVNHTNGN